MARHQNTYHITKDMDYWNIAADEVLLYELKNDYYLCYKNFTEKLEKFRPEDEKNSLKY